MNNFVNNIFSQSANKNISKVVNKAQALSIAFRNLTNANDNDKDILRSATSVNDADTGDLDDITNVIDMFINTKRNTAKKFKVTLDDTELTSVKPVA